MLETQIQTLTKTNNTLLQTFRRRLGRVQLLRQEEMTRYNQLATLGELSAGLTHEIITPLNNIKFNLSVIREQKGIKEEIITALNGVDHIDSLVKNYLGQLKGETKLETFSPYIEITKIHNLLKFKLREKNIRFIIEISKDTKLYGNPVKFSQVMINLIKNAIDSYQEVNEKGSFKIIELKEFRTRTHFKLKIMDFGTGIPEKDKYKIFEKFFTTKPPEKGTGLGLSICKSIIETDFKGRINLTSLKNPTVFQVSIPWPGKRIHST